MPLKITNDFCEAETSLIYSHVENQNLKALFFLKVCMSRLYGHFILSVCLYLALSDRAVPIWRFVFPFDSSELQKMETQGGKEGC